MSIAWRREDSWYMAAAAAAAAIVVYIVIGNFGLIPSPFAAPNAGPSIIEAIQPVVLAPPAPDIEIPRVAAPDPDGAPVAPPVSAGDAASPAVSVSTAPGAAFGVAEPAVVEGLVEDLDSGVDTVLVTLTQANGTKQVIPAVVTCESSTRMKCSWRAKVPSAVAVGYTVTAQAFDRAGNKASSDAIDVTVVNPAGTLEQVGGVVERVPNVLNKLVTGVLGILAPQGR